MKDERRLFLVRGRIVIYLVQYPRRYGDGRSLTADTVLFSLHGGNPSAVQCHAIVPCWRRHDVTTASRGREETSAAATNGPDRQRARSGCYLGNRFRISVKRIVLSFVCYPISVLLSGRRTMSSPGLSFRRSARKYSHVEVDTLL